MKLSLKKARKLEVKINKFLSNIVSESMVSVRVKSTLESARKSIKLANSQFKNNINLKIKLLDARYGIRNQISKANNRSGINDLISEKILLEKKIEVINDTGVSLAPSDHEIIDTFEIKKNNLEKGSGYGQSTSTSFGIVFKEDVATMSDEVVTYEKEIEKIEDKIAAKNLGTKIELSADMLQVLTETRLL